MMTSTATKATPAASPRLPLGCGAAAAGTEGCSAGSAGSFLGTQAEGSSGACCGAEGCFVLAYQLLLKPSFSQNASVWQEIDEQAAQGGQTTHSDGQASDVKEAQFAEGTIFCGI